MHDTSLTSGNFFAELYGQKNYTVLDIGGKDISKTLRRFFEKLDMLYICIDIEEDPSVDIVVKPNEKLPFRTGTIDLVISSSCFEHDPCFWMTFKEICRVLKKDGYFYMNAPSDGPYHKHPGDNWRFYGDAGQALAYWSGLKISNEEVYPVKVEETFFILPKNDIWRDFVCIWKRVDEKQTDIVLSDKLKFDNGKLRQKLLKEGYQCAYMI
jgi:SAM-dependent methyltransferase